MRFHLRWSIAFVVFAASAGAAGAQTVVTGTRPLGGVFSSQGRSGGGTAPMLRLLVDFSGGYDQDVTPEGSPDVPIQVFNPQQSGYVGNATAAMLFRRGTTARFFEGDGGAYFSRATGGAEQLVGGNVSARTATTLGRRNGLTASTSVSYDPTYLFNAFDSIGENVEGGVVPGSRPTRGITEQRWLNGQGNMGLYRSWTPRQRTTVLLGTQRREPVSGPGFESWIYAGSMRHHWNVREHAVIGTSYGYRENVQADGLSGRRVITSQTAELTMTIVKPWSPDRRLLVTVGGGVNQSQLVAGGRSTDFAVPIAAALARLELSRSWSVSIDARRDVAILNSVIPEPLESDVVSLRSVGAVGDRLQLASSVSYTRGGAAVSSRGEFRNIVGTVQIMYAISSRCALFSNYSYYSHRFQEIEVQPGIPSRYELGSVRAGISFGLPIF